EESGLHEGASGVGDIHDRNAVREMVHDVNLALGPGLERDGLEPHDHFAQRLKAFGRRFEHIDTVVGRIWGKEEGVGGRERQRADSPRREGDKRARQSLAPQEYARAQERDKEPETLHEGASLRWFLFLSPRTRPDSLARFESKGYRRGWQGEGLGWLQLR